MSELINRLRDRANKRRNDNDYSIGPDILDEAADTITRLTAELSALRAKAEKLDKMDGMDGAACHLIRQKLDEFGAPRAAFIDDHVANGIVHAKRLALEEAAKVAESHSDDKPSQCNTDWNDGYDDGCEGAAASIRALMGKP